MCQNLLRIACLLPLLLLPEAAAAVPMYIFEVREPTAASPPFSRHVYGCNSCTLTQFDAVVAPAGFEKAAAKLFLPDGAVANLPTPPPGAAPGLDLVPGIPGDDFDYIAEVLSGTLLGIDPIFGPLAVAQVQRDTLFTYDAGRVVHEVQDSDGNTYILFAFDEALSAVVDLDALDSLSPFPLPTGWTYSSRVLDQELMVASGGLANVFSQGIATWQRTTSVPEPGTTLLLALGLGGLAATHRRHRLQHPAR